jgi:hypothetical protein
MTHLKSPRFAAAFRTRFQFVVWDKPQHTLCVGTCNRTARRAEALAREQLKDQRIQHDDGTRPLGGFQ